MIRQGRDSSRSRGRPAAGQSYATDELDRELSRASFQPDQSELTELAQAAANLDDRDGAEQESSGSGTARRVLIGVGGTVLGAGIGTALATGAILTAPVTLPIAIAAGAGTALVTWLGGAALSRSGSNEEPSAGVPRRAEEKARAAIQGTQEWQLRFRELSEQVFNRKLRERLGMISQLVEEISVNLQKEPDDLRSEPILVSRLERVERHLQDYITADVDHLSDQRSRRIRLETEEKFELVQLWLEEVKQRMFDNNEFSLRLGNRTFEAIFNEGAASSGDSVPKQTEET